MSSAIAGLFQTWSMLLLAAIGGVAHAGQKGFDWRSEWEVAKGFRVDIDSEGYQLPAALAFIRTPAKGDKSPLYFVLELRGKVKLVTNDRTIYTFAEGFVRLDPEEELPSYKGEFGAAGICLAPEKGYVFVTFVYKDPSGFLRNNVVRFQSVPKTFSHKAEAQLLFTDVFAADESAPSHQIGGCQVKDDHLYVSVGDGRQAMLSQSLDSTLGKILRMTLDGKPVAANPFYEDNDTRKPRNYIWAYGLRNPFGLKIVQKRVFVAENGMHVDRFMEVRQGENYLWNGKDWSIGTNAIAVFSPAVSPVHMDYHPLDGVLFPPPERGQFYITLAGASPDRGPQGNSKSIVLVDYDLSKNKLRSVPRLLLRYRGNASQIPAGISFGPDGLYLAPLLPDGAGKSVILRLTYDPDHEHPFVMGRDMDNPAFLISQYGCLNCHKLGGMGGTAGPVLDRAELINRLMERLHSAKYVGSLAEIDRLKIEPFVSYTKARRDVAAAEGMDRIRLWLRYRIQEPRFDATNSQMPNFGLSEQQAQLIADYLLKTEPENSSSGVYSRISNYLPTPRYRHVVGAFVLGCVAGLAGMRIQRYRKSTDHSRTH